MEFKIENVDRFKKVISCAKDFGTSMFLFNEEKHVYCQLVDNLDTCIMVFRLEKNFFDSYSSPESGVCMIDTNKFYGILNMAPKDASLKIKKAGNVLKININGGTKKINFNFKTFDDSTSIIPVEQMEYSSKVSMDSSGFEKTMKDVSSIGDECTITIKKNEITYHVDGDSYGEGTFSNEDIEVESLEKEITTKVSSSSLHSISKCSKISSRVKISCGEENPLKCMYETDGCTIEYYLAPKIVEQE